ncbi:MAG: DUF262 domain-containing protein [Christensenellales bacterium]|jgi:uncharacterized protein with ParB-like and HNH nuclease domain
MDDSVRKVYDYCFDGSRRQYRIPVYQRNYDWSVENCKKFLDDIIEAYKKEKNHFIGMIIQVQKNEDNNGLKPFIVVDGQQRLTTIYLLLKALYDLTEREGTKEDLYDGLFNKFRDVDVSIDKVNKIKLKANTYDNKQLLLLMDNEFDSLDKNSNIWTNYNYFKRRIKELIENDDLEHRDIKKGVELLTAAIINLDDNDDPQAIFERINFYGEDLKLDDLIRNFVLMTELDQEALFKKYWKFIEDNIKKDKRPQFFIDFLNSYTTSNVSAKNAYESFKNWSRKVEDVEEVLRKLKQAAKYYSAFIGTSSFYSKEVNDKLAAFRKINQSTIYTFLFKVFDDYENNVIDENVLLKVLDLFINYSVRRKICEVPPNSLRGLYKTLHNRIFTGVQNIEENYYDACVCMLVENLRGNRDEFPNEQNLIQSFCKTKIYARDKIFGKYILGLLENANSREKIDVESSDITIEHIMPQNSKNQDWRNEIGEEYDRVYNEYLNTFGNITLTGYNSSLSDNSFQKKKEILKNTNTKIAFLNKEFLESETWGEQEIKNRAKRLAKAMLEKFSTPIWSGVNYHPTSSADLIMVGLSNPEDITNKTAVYYEFFGERKEVDSFREILSGVMETLYVLLPEKMQELARSNYKIAFAQRAYMSYNKNEFKRFGQIEGTEIYYLINLSGPNILTFIKNLLEETEIDETEFIAYCKEKTVTTKQ